jgi:hypothetical protein
MDWRTDPENKGRERFIQFAFSPATGNRASSIERETGVDQRVKDGIIRISNI